MHTETTQILNLRGQDVSREILKDFVRKHVAEFAFGNNSSMHFWRSLRGYSIIIQS